MNKNTVYKPEEDSQLLAAAVEKYAFGKVLDMGTGSGIQAITAAKKKAVKAVVAADISDDALKFALASAANKKVAHKIKFAKSDLFGKITGKYDTLIFNPPYLPHDEGMADDAIYGGKHGYELLELFLNNCRSHLNDDGIILIVFSSRTNKQKINEAIERNCLEFEEIGQKYLFFETLYVYLIRNSQLLLQLQRKGIEDATLFEKGNRGLIYKANYKGRMVAVKAQRKDTAAFSAIENEIKWLKLLNMEGIGAKLLLFGKDWLSCEFIEGKFIVDFISSCSEKKKIIEVIRQILGQCRTLDKLKINKEEMLRPQKHVIVGKSAEATMLDFERCHKSATPKNITQFCQFLSSNHTTWLLRQKQILLERGKIIAAAKDYKHSQTDEKFKKIESQVR